LLIVDWESRDADTFFFQFSSFSLFQRSVAAVLNDEDLAKIFFEQIVYNSGDKSEDDKTGTSSSGSLGGLILQKVAGNPDIYELMLMIMNNLGQALSQQGIVREAILHHLAAAALLETRLQLLSGVDEEIAKDEILEAQDNLLHTRAHIWRASKVNGEWERFADFDVLKHHVDEIQLKNGMDSALLPFDTLGSDVTPQWRKNIAVKHAESLSLFSRNYSPETQKSRHTHRSINNNKPPLLKLGYLCYDFNDHPTAHLAEGLFLYHNTSKNNDIVVSAYNYGKNDNSSYRENIVMLSGGYQAEGGRFFELSHLGHDSGADLIKSDVPDVLIDMQGFTLGGRPELTARMLAPIQVNYLIFPGTSGATFMHYLVGDRFVTPPEHANFYSEKLSLMPESYQINFYKRHVGESENYSWTKEERRRARVDHGLCEDCFVFANFNKQDKIEPAIFNTWCDVIKSVPGSILCEFLQRVRVCACKSRLRMFCTFGLGAHSVPIIYFPSF